MGQQQIHAKREGNQNQQDDWDEVHNQMLEVQQKNKIQKKLLTVSDPRDAQESEADDVASKVVGGERARVSTASSGNSTERIDRQGKDEKSEEEIDAETIHSLLNRKEVDMVAYFEKEKQQKMTKREQFEQRFPEVEPTYIDLPPDFVGIHTILEKYRNHPVKRMQLKTAYNRLYNEKLKSALDKKLTDTDYEISEDMLMSRFKRRGTDANPKDLNPAVWTSKEFQKANRLVDVFEKETDSNKFFPNVDKAIFISQLRTRLADPNKGVNQGGTWLCGPSACSQVLLNYDPYNYAQMMIDLYRYGKTKQLGKMHASKEMSSITINALGQAQGTGMPVVDYILVGSLRGTASRQEFFFKKPLKYDPRNDSDILSGTYPWEIKDMLENLYGFYIEESGFYLAGESIESIEAAVKAQKIVVLFISHQLDVASNKTKADFRGKGDHDIYDKIGIHYVVVDNSKGFTISGDEITFTYWDYGGGSNPVKVSRKGFHIGVKGYWIAKPKSME